MSREGKQCCVLYTYQIALLYLKPCLGGGGTSLPSSETGFLRRKREVEAQASEGLEGKPFHMYLGQLRRDRLGGGGCSKVFLRAERFKQ